MTKLLHRSFIILYCLLTSFISQAQQISKGQKEEIKIICEQFYEQRNRLLIEESYLTDSLKKIVDPTLFNYLIIDAEAVRLFDYDIHFNEVEFQKVVVVHDSIRCPGTMLFEGEERESNFYYDVAESIQGWRIIGYNGRSVSQEDIASISKYRDSARRIAQEKEALKSIAKTFVNGVDQLFQNGDAELLQTVTTPLNVTYFKLDKTLDSLRNRRHQIFKLKEITDVYVHSDTSADLRMTTFHSGSSRLYLKKRNNKWLVIGERRNAHTQADIESKRKRIAEYGERQAVQKAFTSFASSFASFLKDESNDLGEHCTNEVQHFLRLYKGKCGKIDPLLLHHYPTTFSSYSRVEFSGEEMDSARIYRNETEFLLVKHGGSWKVHNLDAQHYQPLDLVKLEESFLQLKSAFNIRYPHAIQVEEDIPDTEMAVDVIEDSYSRNQHIDTTIYHRFEANISKVPTFVGGAQELRDYIASKTPKSTTASNEFVYFVVEANGTISNVQLVNKAGPNSQIAVAIISEMPPWIPAVKANNVIRMSDIIPVIFE